MLVLGRKLNQEILIGDNIRVVILDMTRTTVKIGITAPDDVRVLRKEILQRPAKGAVASGETAPAAPLSTKAARNHTASRAVSPFEVSATTMTSVNLPGEDRPSAGSVPAPRLGSMADRVRQLRSATEVRIHPRLSAAV